MQRSLLACAIAAATAWTGSVAHGQKVTKPEEFEQAMKTIGASISAGNKAITSDAYADAKAPLVLARQVLASTVPFWTDQKMDAPAKMARDVVRKLDDLDLVLSAEKVDSARATGALKSVTDACSACHTVYREGSRETGYRIKRPSGSLSSLAPQPQTRR